MYENTFVKLCEQSKKNMRIRSIKYEKVTNLQE